MVPQHWPGSEHRPLASLIVNERNSRTHSSKQIEQLMASMREWGWTNPVIVDENSVVIAGHGRIEAAMKLRGGDARFNTAPVIVVRGWSEEKKRAYLIADNQLALNANWDVNRLKVELSDLKGFGFDVSKIGFTMKGLAKILDEPAVPKVNPIYEVVVECSDDAHQRQVLEQLHGMGFKVRALIA